MHYLNKLRLQAGLVIRPELEVTIKQPVVEPVVETKEEELVWEAVNLQFGVDGNGPFNVVNNKGDIHDTYETKEEAQAVAKKLNAKYSNREGKLNEDHFKKGDMVVLTSKDHDYVVVNSVGGEGDDEKYEVRCPITKKTHTYKASELKKSDKTPEQVKQSAMRQSMDESTEQVDEMSPMTSIMLKAMGEKDPEGLVKKQKEESAKKKATKKKTTEEECEMTENAKTVFDTVVDKDENPEPNKDEQSIKKGNEKVTCPPKLLNMLKKEIGEAEKEAEYYRERDEKTASFYGNLAIAMTTLHDCLKAGTHEHMQRAQIEFSSWMSIMQHKVPSEVVDFIMKGGQQRDLKSFYHEVKAKTK